MIEKSGLLGKLSSVICSSSASDFNIHFNFDGSRYDICVALDGSDVYIIYANGAISDIGFKSKFGGYFVKEDLDTGGVNFYKDSYPG